MSGVPSSRVKRFRSRRVRAAVKTSGVMISSRRRLELGGRQGDPIEFLKLLTKILLQRTTVTDIRTKSVFETGQLLNELVLKLAL